MTVERCTFLKRGWAIFLDDKNIWTAAPKHVLITHKHNVPEERYVQTDPEIRLSIAFSTHTCPHAFICLDIHSKHCLHGNMWKANGSLRMGVFVYLDYLPCPRVITSVTDR